MKKAFLTKEQLTNIKEAYLDAEMKVWDIMNTHMLSNTESGDIDELLEINDVEEFENITEQIMSLVWFKLTRYDTDQLREQFESDCILMQENEIRYCHEEAAEFE